MIRRLTAIMFTDMVGYTALMQENEHRARDQRNRQRDVLDVSISNHGGEVLEVHGDGTLSAFPSAVEAVLSAVDIQRALMSEPKVPLRIGVHTGDVVHDEDGVFGDGVNVAARIQSLATPGGVLISAKVFDEVKNQPEIRTQSLGAFELKNVSRPTEVYAVVGGDLTVPDAASLNGHRARAGRSVAVLPFTNMSSDPENEFFSDGVTEEIINALTRVNGLQVTARTSSFAYKGRHEDVRTIAGELGVTSILEGSVRRHGNRVRITAQLIDASDGYHLFSEVYDRSLNDIFETQDEIARTVVEELEHRLMGDAEATPPTTTRPFIPREVSTDAYTEYLRGLDAWRRRTPGATHRAIAFFERSVELDEECWLPYIGLAQAYTMLGAIGQLPPEEAYPRAEAAATRAIELEDRDGAAHASLAAVKLFYRWDFDGAYRSLQKALGLTPGSADVHYLYTLYLAAVADDDGAIEAAEMALQLDPLSLPFNHELAHRYAEAGRYQEAKHQIRRTLDLDPSFRAASETLGILQWIEGDHAEALATFQGVVDNTGDPYKFLPHRALAYVGLGRREEARAMEATLEQRKLDQPHIALDIDFAMMKVALGDVDAAFDHLNRAFDRRLGAFIFMARAPIWDSIKDDPRFGELLERVGLPVVGS